MDAIRFVRITSVLLVVTAAGCLTRAAIRFGADRKPRSGLAMMHGLLAAADITMLIFAAATVGLSNLTSLGLILFVTAATGGACANQNFQ